MQEPREMATKAKKMKKVINPVASPSVIIQKTKYAQPKQKTAANKRMTGNGSAEDYRLLRREYLMLEEESFSLDKDLDEADTETRVLEQQKNALLDQLVVLEGLVHPAQPGTRLGR